MKRVGWMVLLPLALLWSAAGFADDVQSSGADGASLQVVTLSVATLLAEARYPSRWNPLHSNTNPAFAASFPELTANTGNEAPLELSGKRKVRSVSLLTFAEFGKARLFLGVNSKGILGLHFDAFARRINAGNLEVLRMPYLLAAE